MRAYRNPAGWSFKYNPLHTMTDTFVLDSTPPPAPPDKPLTVFQRCVLGIDKAHREKRGRGLNPEEVSALRSCFTTRGARKDNQLVASAPRDPLAKCVWHYIQPNPWKVSIGAVLLSRTEHQDFAKFCDDTIKLRPSVDRDAAALERLGVW